MALDWRLDLVRWHPRLFSVLAESADGSFGYPLCGRGWRDVLVGLCVGIEGALRDRESFEFVRIRQKFGILRADWRGEVSDGTGQAIMEAVNLAVGRSACTCEVCGAVGRLHRHRGWFATRCSQHAKGEPVPPRFGIVGTRAYRRRRGRPGIYYARYDRATGALIEVEPRAFGQEDSTDG
ncbi:MAG TPA: hypothetical protein VHC94_12995 [Nitrobacter sp.]|jgi:hypothetical protein|nr:hypothetical protein [Nitrobacter sp.]